MDQKHEVNIMDSKSGGKKKDLGFAAHVYRKLESHEAVDNAQTVIWFYDNGYNDCIRAPARERVKDAVGKLLKNDAKVPGVKLVHK